MYRLLYDESPSPPIPDAGLSTMAIATAIPPHALSYSYSIHQTPPSAIHHDRTQ